MADDSESPMHDDPIHARETLSAGAVEMGIALSEGQLREFGRFTQMLIEWNERINLTRITDPAEIAIKHYLDSLAMLPLVDVPTGASMIDIGTGAGFPAVPLKIARPDLRLVMADSVRKKLTFLEAVAAELGLADTELVHGRAEDLGRVKAYRERFDLAVSRAVARMSVLSELCIPFCRVGGRFVAYKGPDAGEEVREAERAIMLLGGRVEAVHEFDLPRSDLRRTIIVIKKLKPTANRYPRKAGIPERSPLGQT